MRIIESLDELKGLIGQEVAVSDWTEITQQQVNLFAEATGDHQWIHVDPEQAKDGPFGTTIAHGYLTLALTNLFQPQLLEVQNISMGVNYGANKVRFPAPVPVGSRIRGTGTITEATEIAGGVQTVVTLMVQVEGSEKPACIVESISRWMS